MDAVAAPATGKRRQEGAGAGKGGTSGQRARLRTTCRRAPRRGCLSARGPGGGAGSAAAARWHGTCPGPGARRPSGWGWLRGSRRRRPAHRRPGVAVGRAELTEPQLQLRDSSGDACVGSAGAPGTRLPPASLPPAACRRPSAGLSERGLPRHPAAVLTP